MVFYEEVTLWANGMNNVQAVADGRGQGSTIACVFLESALFIRSISGTATSVRMKNVLHLQTVSVEAIEQLLR